MNCGVVAALPVFPNEPTGRVKIPPFHLIWLGVPPERPRDRADCSFSNDTDAGLIMNLAIAYLEEVAAASWTRSLSRAELGEPGGCGQVEDRDRMMVGGLLRMAKGRATA